MNNYKIIKMLTNDQLFDVLAGAHRLIDHNYMVRSDELRNAMVACEILIKERQFPDVEKQLTELSEKYREVRQQELGRTVTI